MAASKLPWGLRGSQRHLSSARAVLAGQTLIEKIAQGHMVENEQHIVRSMDIIKIQPKHVMTHDNTAAVMNKFQQLQVTRMADARQPVFTLDHNVQDTSDKNKQKYLDIQTFARDMGVDFYPAGTGIGHQIMCERGYVTPGSMVVASDSHSNMYGGLGCLGTPVVRTDAAGIWAIGSAWWQVPKVAKVELVNALRPGVSGKDVIVALCGAFNNDEVLNHAVEFTGDGVAALSVDERLTIANMTTEWGALAGVFPVDGKLQQWYTRQLTRSQKVIDSAQPLSSRLDQTMIDAMQANALQPDEDAVYAKTLRLDLSSVMPYVSGPNSVKVMSRIDTMSREKIPVNKAYLVSCVNARVSDLKAAADVLRNKTIAPGVEFYVAPASEEVREESEANQDWQVLLAAGCIPLPAGCGPCIGLGTGLLEDGEVGISATNRNFKGRMGSPNALAYLASPAVVAASAVAGYITASEQLLATPTQELVFSETLHEEGSAKPSALSEFIGGFPSRIEGECVLCLDDNINTDGIYPGKYTYREDISDQEQAKVAMENYDTAFASVVKPGSVLVTGFNFGTGSSREQAATALKHAGIQLVICGSVNETYKRNALNNGLLVLELPKLVRSFKRGVANTAVFTDEAIVADFASSTLTWQGQTYVLPPVSKTAQELIVVGGLEAWISRQL